MAGEGRGAGVSKKPWMPLYIADYLKDTTHLGALESGAYLHLIMDYWTNGGLPDDERQLARIAKLTEKEWKACRTTLQAFFHDGWKHKRIDQEIAHASDVSEKRKKAVAEREQRRQQTAITSASNDASIDDTVHISQRKKDAADAAPPDPEKELFARGREVLGKQAGGLITKLLAAKQKNIALARAAIEQASTKHDPREYIGRIINSQKPGETAWLGGIEGII
jgi:uncharacterized protein YdaU (DUF1376 family)